MPARTPGLDVLARPGANDKVVEKKVLLAELARREAVRLGIAPQETQVQELAAAFLRELELADRESVAAWLAQAGLSDEDFNTVISDFAAVLAVEAHYRDLLTARVELHRRLIAARIRKLAAPA